MIDAEARKRIAHLEQVLLDVAKGLNEGGGARPNTTTFGSANSLKKAVDAIEAAGLTGKI